MPRIEEAPSAPPWEKYLIGFGTLLCLLVIGANLVKGSGRTDLGIFLLAAGNLESGRPVYSLTDPNEHTKPPLATLLFVPLTHVDREKLGRFWDALAILSYLGLAWFIVAKCAAQSTLSTRAMVMLALLVTLNPWNKEIHLGQYNVLTLVLMMIAALGPSAVLGGIFVLIAVLLKPTNILFLPWIWRHQSGHRGLVRGVLGAAYVLTAIYVWKFGLHSLRVQHEAWLQLLPLSSAKHLHRADNFALVKVVDELGGGRWIPGLWALGWAAVFLAAYRTRGWLAGLSTAAIACILLTPMAWFQNYVLCLPFVVFLLARIFSSRLDWGQRLASALAVLFLYFGLEVSQALTNLGLGGEFCRRALPLWSLLLAVAAIAVGWGWSAIRGAQAIPVESSGGG